MRNVIF